MCICAVDDISTTSVATKAFEALFLNVQERHSVPSMTYNSTVRLYHDGQTQSVAALSLTILTNHPFYLRSISSHIFPVWDEPWSFHNTCYLVLFCLDLSRTGAAADIITGLDTSPPHSVLQPAFLPVQSGGDGTGFWCVTCPKAGSGFSCMSRTCAKWQLNSVCFGISVAHVRRPRKA